ncbi:hypothetical protein R3P38DRAFT_1853816 [Favolaschia claudopus]|uniref:Acetyl-CoA synthetase-like protein n=1 Tax=Favolaschia claudopus TaxID=2862362 RepID=A0AAW0DAK6_9AGAR
MTEFHGPPLDPRTIPSDLTLAEFMLDYHHPLRSPQNGIPCLIDDATGRKVSLQELRERTMALAQGLRGRYNIGEGDVVLICSPNHVDFPVAIWAPQYLGAIFTGANPNSTPNELLYQIKITGATMIIAHLDALETAREAASLAGIPLDRVLLLNYHGNNKVDAISVPALISESVSRGKTFVRRRRMAPGDAKKKIVALSLSSGTTGPPKAVAISHFAIIANLVQLSTANPDAQKVFTPGDVVSGLLPFFHVAGLGFNLHWMLFCATTVVVTPKFSLVGVLDSIARYRIQHLLLVPPAAIAFCKTPVVKKYDLSKVKYIGCGAAPMTSDLQDLLSQLCPQAAIGQCYGTTETPACLTMTPLTQQFTSGSAGRLLPGMHARIVKSDGTLAGYDETGELVVKSPSLSLGYYNNQAATDEAFTSEPDRWYRTGDEVKMNKAGELFITGRLKELITVRAFQVSPVELEGLILNHPDVSDACVIGVPDDYSGEVPRAYVVLSEAASRKAKTEPEAIQASIAKLVADNKSKYKHLAGGVVFVPFIPKNPSGKILRRVLKEQVKEEMKAKL